MTIRDEFLFVVVMVVAVFIMGWASGPLLGRYVSYGIGAGAIAAVGAIHLAWRKYHAR